MPSTPRLAPLPLAEWDAELRERFQRPGGLGQIVNVMHTLAHHTGLFKRWLVFANHFLFKSTLSPRHREIVILRSGWLADCEYEWGQHVKIAAEDAGFTEAEYTALAAGADAPLWSPADAALIRAADGLYREAFVDDATWAALTRHFHEKQILDAVFTVGNYGMLAMALNTLGVQLDEGYSGFRTALPRHTQGPSATLPAMGIRRPTPRLAPLPEAEWTPEQRDLLAKARGHLPTVHVLETLVRHPDLLRRWMPFFNHVLHKSTLPARDREILILRVGRLCGAEYEWSQHVPFAERAGLSQEEIRGIVVGAEAPVWRAAHERTLLQVADQLHRTSRLDEATWEKLSQHYTTQQKMDVIFTVGQYRLVCAALNTLCVQLDSYLQPYSV